MPEALERLRLRPAKPLRHISDNDIDYSDIPELTSEQMKQMRPASWIVERDGRIKKLVQIPLDSELVTGLKREAKRKRTTYQLLIHRILKDHLAQVR